MTFDVSTQLADDHACLMLSGDLDMASAPALRTALSDAITGGVTNLVLDVTEVPFLDSTALGALIEAYKLVEPIGGGIALVGVRPAVVRLLTLTNLSSRLPAYGSVADAAAALRSRAPAETP